MLNLKQKEQKGMREGLI